MKFIKNFNNNAALVSDESGIEWVVIGNGIGFGKKPNDPIDEAKITRRFVAVKKNIKMIDSVSNIDERTLSLATDVIELASNKLQVKFSDYQYLVLADHIDFMLKRADEGLDLGQATVRWEMNKLFPKEYSTAKAALKVIEKKTSLAFSNSEEIYLTYHFINAASNQTKIQDTIKITKLIQGVINIIEYQYGLQLDTESFNFNRFMTHLRSFMVRHLYDTGADSAGSELDESLLELMRVKYQKAYKTALKIGAYLSKQAGWDLQPDDEVYLTLHIWRVTHRQRDDKVQKK
ncbi:BglG family transcription antiterminator [Lactobacillus xylocopicola]|uniref:Transcription antitermination protein BlgG n=1 Tax=Lactobacillus xylocopicola TaxID=2976676 RepID=A0ABM8BJ16_9LACO|nr:PRD domain-containing protein [Lactobacillus xylocopicola]BDR61139.1 transcription antitermination protein BlgG [Lactobacillus xylocopicola]